jgi:hypothetical protein
MYCLQKASCSDANVTYRGVVVKQITSHVQLYSSVGQVSVG